MSERALDPRCTITIVSGMPRSGTSMMMQMLEAAGLEIESDGERCADADNPNGYFELEAVKRLEGDASFLAHSLGKVVKIVAPLLVHLPTTYDYRVVFMERDMDEVMASQRAMLRRSGDRESSEYECRALDRAFSERIRIVKDRLAESENIRTCYVSHRNVLDSPEKASLEVVGFLDETGAFAKEPYSLEERQRLSLRMVGIVDRSLYRQRLHPRAKRAVDASSI